MKRVPMAVFGCLFLAAALVDVYGARIRAALALIFVVLVVSALWGLT